MTNERWALCCADLLLVISFAILFRHFLLIVPPWAIVTACALGTFYVALWIRVIVHELAHFYVALRLGMPIVRVSFGVGAERFRFTYRGMLFVLLTHPESLRTTSDGMAGYVRLAWPSSKLWKNIAFLTAGPVADATMLVCALWLDLNLGFILIFATTLFFDLFGKGSDGAQIRQFLRKRPR